MSAQQHKVPQGSLGSLSVLQPLLDNTCAQRQHSLSKQELGLASLATIKSSRQQMNTEKTEDIAKVSKDFRGLVRLSLLNYLDLPYRYREEFSKDLSVLYTEKNPICVLWQSSKETKARGKMDEGHHKGDHRAFSPRYFTALTVLLRNYNAVFKTFLQTRRNNVFSQNRSNVFSQKKPVKSDEKK